MRPAALIEIADRNGVALPAHDVDALAELYRFRDFDHFIELWMMTTHVIQTEVDFRQVVVSYAQEAAAHGAVYIEGIFTPAERISGGASWDEVFTGFCDGAATSKGDDRRRGPPDARHPPRVPRRGRGRDRALLREVPRSRRRRARARRPRVGVPAGAVRARVSHRAGRRSRLGPARGRDRRRRLDPRLDRRARRRPAPARHSRRRRSGAARRNRGARHRVRRVPDLECAYSRRRHHRDPSPARHARGGRAVLDQHRRSRDVRHRPHPRVRSRGRDSASRPRTRTAAGVAGALCDAATKATLTDIGAAFPWPGTPPG